MSFVYPCGGQKASLPKHALEALQKAESEGRAVVPDWVDQVAVLNNKARSTARPPSSSVKLGWHIQVAAESMEKTTSP
jgi:hypothetical protein